MTAIEGGVIDTQIASLVSLALFYLLVLAIGAYAGRSGNGSSGADSFLLAGRGMPMMLGVFTMTATWVGGGYINGTAEAVYNPEQGLLWCQAPWGYALSLILGGLFFAGRMRRSGYTTMLDPFEQRYGNRVAAGLLIPAVMGEIFWSAAILAALGMTFSVILGIDVKTSILISAAVTIGYTMVGGLWSVACTDVVQLLCILFGLALVIPYAAEHVGGIGPAFAEYFRQQENRPAFPGQTLWSWIDVGLMLILGGIPWQVYFQRVLACRDDRTAVRLSLIAGVGCALMAIPAIIIGVVGATVDWTAAGIDSPSSAAMVLPHVVDTLAPSAVSVIALGAVAAAVMSSVDSSILSASTLLTWNIYRPLLRPQATDREFRTVVRLATLAVGITATSLALAAESVYVLWYLCSDLVYVVLFPQLLLVLYSRRMSWRACVSGVAVGSIVRLAAGVPELGFNAISDFPLDGNFPYRTAAMLANLFVSLLLSCKNRPHQTAAT